MTDRHAHDDFSVPAGAVVVYERFGGVDTDVLSRLVGSAVDGCRSCQSSLLDRLMELPVTVAKLVEVSATMVVDALGGMPPRMQGSADYVRVVETGRARREEGIVAVVESLDPRRRREVADEALDLVVGVAHARSAM